MLSSCDPDKSKAGSKPSPLNLVVVQPKSADAVNPVMKSLRETLKARAVATKGASTTALTMEVIQPGSVPIKLSVPAPTGIMVSIFGTDSPKAREQKLEALLTALENRLKSGSGGKAFDVKALKSLPMLANAGKFVVWAAGGGDNPWTPQENGPAGFHEDITAFDALVEGKPVQNLLVLTEPLLLPLSESEQSAKAKSVEPQSPPAPTGDPNTKTEDAPKLAVKTTEASAGIKPDGLNEPRDPRVIVSPSTPLVFNFGDRSKTGQSSQSPEYLLEDTALLGHITFLELGSVSLDAVAKSEMGRYAEEYKLLARQGEVTLVMTSSADAEKGSTPGRNQQISDQRAAACEASDILTCGESGWPQGGEFHHHGGPGVGRFGGV
jgi:hypothetical protein